ncbi:large exoprotein [Microbacterium sp. bgisy189]|uniref:large exoprotein n=1 Tax=Microbacterium sp. bgisy189 TaxID=3413798 RepID=UPI003EB6A078
MDGQVLGGGVIVLVAVALWLVYLLPSWHGRHQYEAAERNAVRLNQALRVLAETSETPDEVRFELNARTAHAQQKLAKQVQTERHEAQLQTSRAEAETERATARAQAAAAIAEAAARREQARVDEAAARALPAARRARTRRRVRLVATLVGVVGAAVGVWGGIIVVTGGAQLVLWTGVAVAALAGLALRRMSTVQRQAAARVAAPIVAERIAADIQDLEVSDPRASWTPRPLPRPLASSSGSRAAAVLDQAAAREALRRVALDDAMRARAEQNRPPSIDTARRARPEQAPAAVTAAADDSVIEAHVRDLLERRAAGM